jgi:hypothetical protein
MQKAVSYIMATAFVILILRSFIKGVKPTLVEGITTNTMTYKDPGLSSDPLYLATLNAANIAYLKEQIDGIIKMKSSFQKLIDQVDSNSTNIQALNKAVESTQQSIPDNNTMSQLADTGNSTPPGAR